MDSSSPPPADVPFSRTYPQNQSYNFSHDTNPFLNPNIRGQMLNNRQFDQGPVYSHTSQQSINDMAYTQKNAITSHQNSSSTSNSFALTHNSHFPSQMTHILATASQFDLIQAQNPAYTQLQMEFRTLTDENRLLREKLVKVEVQSQTNELALKNFMEKLPLISNSNSNSNYHVIPLKKADYPLVNFWTLEDYTDSLKLGDSATDVNTTAGKRGQQRDAQGRKLNICERYIENQDGSLVNGSVTATMKAKCRSLWIQMALDGTAPQSWTKVGEVAGAKFRYDMGVAFPELRLCEHDWKVQRLAVQNYSNFDPEAFVKSEPMDDSSSIKQAKISKKRKHKGKDRTDIKLEPKVAKIALSTSSSIIEILDDDDPHLLDRSNTPAPPPVASTSTSGHAGVTAPSAKPIKVPNPFSSWAAKKPRTVPTSTVKPPTSKAPVADLLSTSKAPSAPPANASSSSITNSTAPSSSTAKHSDIDNSANFKPSASVPATNTMPKNTSKAAAVAAPIQKAIPRLSSAYPLPPIPNKASGSGTVPDPEEIAAALKEQKKKNARYKPALADTARNLFGRDWLSKNPEGTVAQFQAALASVDRTNEFANKYKAEENRLRAKKKADMKAAAK